MGGGGGGSPGGGCGQCRKDGNRDLADQLAIDNDNVNGLVMTTTGECVMVAETEFETVVSQAMFFQNGNLVVANLGGQFLEMTSRQPFAVLWSTALQLKQPLVSRYRREDFDRLIAQRNISLRDCFIDEANNNRVEISGLITDENFQLAQPGTQFGGGSHSTGPIPILVGPDGSAAAPGAAP